MPIDITYDADLDVLVLQAIGVIEYRDLTVLARGMIEHPEFRTDIDQLFDCTDGELALSSEDLQQVAKDFTSIADVLGMNRKLALLVSRTVDFGKMRQYEVYFRSGPGVRVSVFKDRAAALGWLRTDRKRPRDE